MLFCCYMALNDGSVRLLEEEEEVVEAMYKNKLQKCEESIYFISLNSREVSSIQQNSFQFPNLNCSLYSNPDLDKPMLPPEFA